MTAVLYLCLALSADTSALIVRLGSPSFRGREQAERTLAARMCYPLALRLDNAGDSPEARVRAARLVRRYYADACPALTEMPFIDALSWPNCGGCHNDLSRYYYRRANGAYPIQIDASYPTFRAGAAFMVWDMVRWRVPPAVIRAILGAMKVRSDSWEFNRNR